MSKEFEKLIFSEIDEHIAITSGIFKFSQAITSLVEMMVKCFDEDGKILICGNGGSAADAQHLSSELVGRYESDRKGYPALSLSTDSSAVTAISNDYGFQDVFSRQVESLGKEKDILIIFSTSGNSENLLNAINVAKQIGIYTFGFLGKDGGQAKKILASEIIIQSNRTCRVQEMHSLLIHVICQLLENY